MDKITVQMDESINVVLNARLCSISPYQFMSHIIIRSCMVWPLLFVCVPAQDFRARSDYKLLEIFHFDVQCHAFVGPVAWALCCLFRLVILGTHGCLLHARASNLIVALDTYLH